MIAVFEAGKGVLVLLLAMASSPCCTTIWKRRPIASCGCCTWPPANAWRGSCCTAAATVTDARLWALAAGAAAYSIVRFIEAYGLWRRRDWAQWFALLSGAVYLPWELYEVLVHTSPTRVALLALNLLLVAYLLVARVRTTRRALRATATASLGQTIS